MGPPPLSSSEPPASMERGEPRRGCCHWRVEVPSPCPFMFICDVCPFSLISHFHLRSSFGVLYLIHIVKIARLGW